MQNAFEKLIYNLKEVYAFEEKLAPQSLDYYNCKSNKFTSKSKLYWRITRKVGRDKEVTVKSCSYRVNFRVESKVSKIC